VKNCEKLTIDPTSHQNLKPCFGHNFGTAQDIDMIQTPISFFFQALSDGLTFS
jgi:hypothetical protein